MSNYAYIRILYALIFSILITIALFYLTLEIPYELDKYLHNYYPDIFWEFGLREKFLNTVRPYEYMSLAIVIILILLGFYLKKTYLSLLGLYLYISPYLDTSLLQCSS